MIKERMIQGLLWMGGSRAFEQVLLWLLNIFVARLLMPEDYGLMALASVVIYFTNYFFELSIGQALVQREELHEEEQDAAFWLMLTLSVLVYGACYLLAGPIASFFSEPRLAPILQVYGISFILLALSSVPTSLLQRQLRFRVLALRNVIADTIAGVAVLLFALLGWGVWSLVGGALIRNVLYAIYCFASAGWVPQLRFRWRRARPLLDFGLPLTLSKFMNTVVSNADVLIIGKLLGSENLGFYYMAQRFTVTPVVRASLVLFEVTFPIMSRIQERIDVFRSSLRRMTEYLALFALPAFAGLFVLSEPLVLLLLGEKWAPIVPLIHILCFAGFLRSVLSPLGSMVLALGDTQGLLHFNLLSLVFIPASLYLGALVDLQTALLTWIVTYPLVSMALLRLVLRRTGMPVQEYARAFLPPVLPALAMGAFLAWYTAAVHVTTLPRLLLAILGGAAVYAAYFWFLRRRYLLDILAVLRRRG